MRKTNSIYSQTFCIVEFSLNPLSRPWTFLENKATFAVLQFLGRHEPRSLHAQQIPGHGWQLVQESNPRCQPAAFRLPFGLMASSAYSSFLASLCRHGGVFSWVPCFSVHSCKPQHTPAALKHL